MDNLSNNLAFPVSWDSAIVINLTVVGVKDLLQWQVKSLWLVKDLLVHHLISGWKIEEKYVVWKALKLLHCGLDFVADLFAFIDVLQRIVDLMSRVHSFDTLIPKFKLLWLIVDAWLLQASQCDPQVFPCLNNAKNLRPGCKFHKSHCWRFCLSPRMKDTNQQISKSLKNWKKMRKSMQISRD